MYFSHAILLVHVAVLSGAVHLKKEEVAETINELDTINGRQLREIKQHRQLQDKDESYISNGNAFQGNRQLKENLRTLDQKKGFEEGYKLDNITDLDPDSDLAFLLNEMSIDDHGQIHQPIGRNTKNSTRAIADNLDYHPDPPSDPSKRNFAPNIKLWPGKIVPYEINSTFTADERTKILNAIADFNRKTCVQWIPYDSNTHDHYVYFNDGTGCNSYVGQIRYIPQYVNLKRSSCLTNGIIIHEMLHAVGSYHEMSRKDRDNYMTVEMSNIIGGTGNVNYKLQQTSDISPFDPASDVMYNIYSFSTNGDKTVLFHDWRQEFLAGTGKTLSFYDIADVTAAYGCTDSCVSPPTCQHGGFVDKTCSCACPGDLIGTVCQQLDQSNFDCGGTINISGDETYFLTSPNYPSNYDLDMECAWLIQGDPGNHIRATVTDMDISNNDNACYHWIEMVYDLLANKGPMRCGTTDHEVWDTSFDGEMNTMIIKFDSFTGGDKAASRGFNITLESIGTGCENNSCVHGSCYSPMNSNSYTCTCNQGFSGTNCDVPSVYSIFECTAEIDHYCMFVQSTDDDFNWGKKSGPGSNSVPGGAKEGFVYLYTRSTLKTKGQDAVMSTEISFPKVERCLSFWYHMYSWIAKSDIGTIQITMTDSTGIVTSLFSRSGSQSSKWLQAKIDIPAVDNLKITIKGTNGFGKVREMALDGIFLVPGTCGSPLSKPAQTTTTTKTTPNTTTTATTTATPTTTAISTTTATPSTTTTLTTTATPSTKTTATTTATPSTTATSTTTATPSTTTTLTTTATPSTTTTATTTATPSTKTTLTTTATPSTKTTATTTATPSTKTTLTTTATPSTTTTLTTTATPSTKTTLTTTATPSTKTTLTTTATPSTKTTLTTTATPSTKTTATTTATPSTKNTLTTTATPSTKTTAITTATPSTKTTLTTTATPSTTTTATTTATPSTKTTVTTTATPSTKTTLTTTATSSTKTTLTTTATPSTKTTATTTTTPTTTTTGPSSTKVIECGFEQGQTCAFANTNGDDFDWTLDKSGSTSTPNTGPSAAHSGNQYAYIEVNGQGQDSYAFLSSTNTKLSSSSYCLRFCYHMYGQHIGYLAVYSQNRNSGWWSKPWTRSGNQGNQWIQASVTITTSKKPSDIVIDIEASKGSSGNFGDIAIDDITLSTGSC
ncbi:serine-rich adhesin for platelets-like [Mytilus trossulus]|uniref:serine-rich adhesin for platelets-like n=1 Tax=Mytilus trossulus TaxID=6551 RepID=UPI003004F713